MSVLGELLGIEEPKKLNTDALEAAMGLTEQEQAINDASTADAEGRILSEVNQDVVDTNFGADLDELTNYARQHSETGVEQTRFQAGRMGVDIDPALDRTLDRQESLGSALTGVNTRNRARMDMRESRMDNMAEAIGNSDYRLSLELQELQGEQNLVNIKHGFPDDGSGFDMGGAIKGGVAGYQASGGTPWGAVIGAFAGAFL